MILRTRVLLLVTWSVAAGWWALCGQAPKKAAIAYPKGYRKWTHVKTMVIFSKEHKLFDAFGGLHNVYLNDVGWPSLKDGKAYLDGAVFVFELQDIRTYQGALEARGRKFLAVMKKNTKLYRDTGGWGFEVFEGYQVKGSLKDAKKCFDCHASQKPRDYVFSDYME